MIGFLSGETGASLMALFGRNRINAGNNVQIVSRSVKSGTMLRRTVAAPAAPPPQTGDIFGIAEYIDAPIAANTDSFDVGPPALALRFEIYSLAIALSGDGDANPISYSVRVLVDGTPVTFVGFGADVAVPLPGLTIISAIADPGQFVRPDSDIVFVRTATAPGGFPGESFGDASIDLFAYEVL
jgi:hypothetical protein